MLYEISYKTDIKSLIVNNDEDNMSAASLR